MLYAVGTDDTAHDLAAIVDSERIGRCGAREIDLGEGQSVSVALTLGTTALT
jgi:hypothetical protein